MPEEGRPHLFLPNSQDTMPYRPRPIRVAPEELPARNRVQHGEFLMQRFGEAMQESATQRQNARDLIPEAPEPDGIYLQIQSEPEIQLALSSLEMQRSNIELLAVTTFNNSTIATIFLPDSKRDLFFRKLQRYTLENGPNGLPKGNNLVARIADLKLATLKSLWTDNPDLYPAEGVEIWWEVWLRRDQDEDGTRFKSLVEQLGLRCGPRTQTFLDRTVVLVCGTAALLSTSIDLLGVIAEVRLADPGPSFFASLSHHERGEWIKELGQRLAAPASDSPTVCLLDTGVNHAHPLLSPALDPADVQTVDPAWGAHDHDGHGTEMAGLALYGDLRKPLGTGSPVRLTHRLESVKIIGPGRSNDPELYGKVTAEAVARAEIQAPNRKRIHSMSVASSEERDAGKPSAWSAELDNLSIGSETSDLSQKRLFITCAGNRDFRRGSADFFPESLTDGVHSPGQSWNALTVGACTHLCVVHDPTFRGWQVLADSGDLSPSSTTSCSWERQWPIKPELVFEGGNAIFDPASGAIDAHDDLSVLTTHHQVTGRSLCMSGETSAATAQVAQCAAILQEAYPTAWPETIRGLLVHSSEWTQAMLNRVPGRSRSAVLQRLRCFGYGVPNMERARYSLRNGLTLIAQDQMRPYEGGQTKEMKFHRLPWPKQALLDLGETPVKLRVTLSYFIEANPARRGWVKKHRYASHGYRLDLQGPLETEAAFKLRINQRAWEMEQFQGEEAGQGDSSEWLLGSRLRSPGSIHSDTWEGSAAQLAARDLLAVFPVIGWWRERKKHDRCEQDARYSLIVSIDTPSQEVDLYHLISQQISIPVPVMIQAFPD